MNGSGTAVVDVPPGVGAGPVRRTTLPGGDPVLETKLVPPRWRHRIVPRPRLVDRLDAERDVPLVAAIAPPGYGKSALFAQWASRSERPVAWLTVDERDSDPRVLLGYIAVAVDRATALEPDVFETLASPGPSVWTAAVPRLGAAFATTQEPFLLILDDADRLESGVAMEAVVALAAHLQSGSQLALALRHPDRLPVPRLVAAEMMTVVDRDELALDDAEAGQLLQATGTPLAAREVRELNEATEGWAAGLYFTALERSGRDAREAAGEAGGEDGTAGASATGPGLVGDYLRSEVLDAIPEDRQRFLVRASVLDRVNGAVLDAILERRDSSAVLEELAAPNLLLRRVDGPGDWYRWHRMLRDLLGRELLRRDRDLVPALNRRAADWHERAGRPEEALEYAMAAEDEERVARLLPPLARSAYDEGRIDTVLRWFDWLEHHDAPDRHLVEAAIGSILFALVGDPGRAHRWADLAAAARPATSGEVGLAAFLRAFLARGGISQMREDADEAVRLLPPQDAWFPAARAIRGIALALESRTHAAEFDLATAAERLLAGGGGRMPMAIALSFRASLAIQRGDWPTAHTLVRRARTTVIEGRLAEQPEGVLVDALAARIAAHRGALPQARTDATHADRFRAVLTHAVPWLAIRARLDLGAAFLTLGEPGRARVILEEIREVLWWQPAMGALVDEVRDLAARVESTTSAPPDAATLTLAELRLLPFLATHLSFREIASRLNLSTNTIKTQAKSIYRKLDTGSRSEAVERARLFGLLDAPA